jgi:signal transduction histidine kinase
MAKMTSFNDHIDDLRRTIDDLVDSSEGQALQRAHEARARLELLSLAPTANLEHARLAMLYEASRAFGSSLDQTEALNQVMDAVINLTGAGRGCVLLIDRETGELDLQAARNFERRDLDHEEMQVSRTVINEVLKSGDGVVTSNAQTDTRFADHASVMRYSLRSIICVPLRVRGEVIGVVYVDNAAKSGLFDTNDGEMLEALASQAAVAIENARLYTQTDAALAQRVAELETLQQIDRELNTGLDLERVLELTLAWAVRETGAEDGWIAIRSGDTPVMSIVAGLGKGSSFKYSGDEIVQESFASITDIPATHDDFSGATLTFPIKREDETIAFIGVVNSTAPFSPNARPYLNRLVDHAAVAIENTRLYRSVEAANLAKSQFISVVSHELRMPMTAISGYADLLRQGTAGAVTEKQEKYLDTIRSNIARMEVLVSDLSDISRIETGRLRITSPSIPLQTYIRETVAGLMPQFDEKNQSLQLEMPKELPNVKADPSRLVQVLTNLISNANKYTAEGESVTIQAESDGTRARVIVSDNGIGISTADQADLFSQFFRSDDPLVREQQGWGLGLHVARRLVQLMGGEIGFESSLGEGSTFWFSLPVDLDESAS